MELNLIAGPYKNDELNLGLNFDYYIIYKYKDGILNVLYSSENKLIDVLDKGYFLVDKDFLLSEVENLFEGFEWF